MQYDVNYFINKFEAIPEENIGRGSYANHCTMFHCGAKEIGGNYVLNDEAKVLADLFQKVLPFKNEPYQNIYYINDGLSNEYQQPTPKQRILAALHDIKKMQQPVYEDVRKSLAVMPVSETPDLVFQNQTA